MDIPKVVKKIWAWVSHGDTAWGIMNILFPSLAGTGGGFYTWVTYLSPVWTFFAVLGGIALGLIVSNQLAARRIQKSYQLSSDNQPQSPAAATDYNQRYADWMATAIQDDVRDLPGCVMVSEPHICWEHLEEREDAYIEFNFDIWSSSVLLLEISKQVEEHIWFKGGKLERIPEITQKASQLTQLRRSKSARLTIRQWLSFPVKVRMKTEYSSQVEFDFSKVNISVVATLPDGSQGLTCRLPIPDVVRTQMPNHPNAPVPDTRGSQTE